jgi:hypothetical protein
MICAYSVDHIGYLDGVRRIFFFLRGDAVVPFIRLALSIFLTLIFSITHERLVLYGFLSFRSRVNCGFKTQKDDAAL